MSVDHDPATGSDAFGDAASSVAATPKPACLCQARTPHWATPLEHAVGLVNLEKSMVAFHLGPSDHEEESSLTN